MSALAYAMSRPRAVRRRVPANSGGRRRRSRRHRASSTVRAAEGVVAGVPRLLALLGPGQVDRKCSSAAVSTAPEEATLPATTPPSPAAVCRDSTPDRPRPGHRVSERRHRAQSPTSSRPAPHGRCPPIRERQGRAPARRGVLKAPQRAARGHGYRFPRGACFSGVRRIKFH